HPDGWRSSPPDGKARRRYAGDDRGRLHGAHAADHWSKDTRQRSLKPYGEEKDHFRGGCRSRFAKSGGRCPPPRPVDIGTYVASRFVFVGFLSAVMSPFVHCC